MAPDVAQLGLAAVITAIIAVLTFVVTRRWLSLSTDDSCPDPVASAKPARTPITYQIRGVPIGWTEPQLQAYLLEHVEKDSPNVTSLATEIHGSSGTATATFQGEPPEVIALPKPADQTGPTRYLAIDKDFLGVTTLYAPPPVDHLLE